MECPRNCAGCLGCPSLQDTAPVLTKLPAQWRGHSSWREWECSVAGQCPWQFVGAVGTETKGTCLGGTQCWGSMPGWRLTTGQVLPAKRPLQFVLSTLFHGHFSVLTHQGLWGNIEVLLSREFFSPLTLALWSQSPHERKESDWTERPSWEESSGRFLLYCLQIRKLLLRLVST